MCHIMMFQAMTDQNTIAVPKDFNAAETFLSPSDIEAVIMS